MAKYVMQELPDMSGAGERLKYPRMLIERQTDLEAIAATLSSNTTFGREEITAVVQMVAEEVGRLIAQGTSVRVDGLGIFSAKLGLKKGVEPEREGGTKRIANSIEIANVHFRPDKNLLWVANKNCHLKRTHAKKYNKPNTNLEQRMKLVQEFLREHFVLTLQDYVALIGVSRTTASSELRKFASQGLLRVQGRGSHLIYKLPE
ncbi:HU family DNA-binding protein [Porphyromonas circumdentaria]|uniref:HU family DNA-binding protein n=1 Tax=Porphyromonas circumdentaria TaxID=29524 RepID=UPI0026DB27FD|nr:HU family DNA-binding protein [Porphyromonas circumdentaria]MDO4721883.1 DNA-binding protein [Porphyromonas circumdentaria]